MKFNPFDVLMGIVWLVILSVISLIVMAFYDHFIRGTTLELVAAASFGLLVFGFFFVLLIKLFVMLCRGELGDNPAPTPKENSVPTPTQPQATPGGQALDMVAVFLACLCGAVFICTLFTL